MLFTPCLSLFSCNSQSQNIETENDKIFNEFNQWKSDVLKKGIFVDSCPTPEEFEAIKDTAKYNKLQNAQILPKEYSVSFGQFNDDNKIDALFSFSNLTCGIKNELAIRSIPGIKKARNVILIESTPDGYEVSENIINFENIEQVIQKGLKAINASISITEIYKENSLRGVCKVWTRENFKGQCCPDKLFILTVDTKEKKIWLHINDYEYQTEYEINYK